MDFAFECCYLKQLPEYKAFEQYVEEWLEDSDVGDYIYDLAVARDRYLIESLNSSKI